MTSPYNNHYLRFISNDLILMNYILVADFDKVDREYLTSS